MIPASFARVATIVFCLAAWTASADAQTYTITDLGPICQAAGINGSGAVTGIARQHAFVYAEDVMTDLGTLGGEYSEGQAINTGGEVVGYATRADGSYRAFLSIGGRMTDLGTLGADYSVAYAINDAGQVAGSSTTADGRSHAFLYSGGRMIDLGTLGADVPGWTTAALGINASGQVVGYSYVPTGEFHAFAYAGGVMRDLGTLGGSLSQAYAINAAGQIVGQAYLAGNAAAHAVLWSAGSAIDLGALNRYSSGLAINGAGLVVGSADVRSRSQYLVYHAVVYRNGAPVDLNRLIPARSGWILSAATAVNDAGQIAGYGTLRGVQHGFLLTPE